MMIDPGHNFAHDTTEGLSGLSLQQRHNGRDGVSNHQPHDCLLNRLVKALIKETSKLRVIGPLWGEFTGDR